MGQYCKNCGKKMKNPKLSHCSDECVFTSVKNSKSVSNKYKAELWDEKADPWV
jgi:hypothetical protein